VTAEEIVSFIQCRRFSLHSETKTHDEFFVEMAQDGVSLDREVEIAPGDRIDFMHGTIGIEFKVKGQRRAIYRQCERYCQSDRVHQLVLASNISMGSLKEIAGKPVFVAHLGRGWM
jgi:hypothetical protein